MGISNQLRDSLGATVAGLRVISELPQRLALIQRRYVRTPAYWQGLNREMSQHGQVEGGGNLNFRGTWTGALTLPPPPLSTWLSVPQLPAVELPSTERRTRWRTGGDKTGKHPSGLHSTLPSQAHGTELPLPSGAPVCLGCPCSWQPHPPGTASWQPGSQPDPYCALKPGVIRSQPAFL